MNEVREQPEIELKSNKAPERSRSKPKRKVGVFGRTEYDYWILDELNGRSALFRKHLIRWNDERGMIGVMFDDGELAWSMKVPRHISLEEQEGKTATARIQTQRLFHDPFPKIQVHAKNVDDAIKLASFVQRNAPSSQLLLDITLVDSFTNPSGRYEIGFRGLISDYDPKVVKEELGGSI